MVQQGRTASFGHSHGDGLQVEYQGAPPAAAGREAWLIGGGDYSKLVYDNPHRR